MSREIKFRAWSQDSKIMGEPFNLRDELTSDHIADNTDRWLTDTIFLQFTGLFDRNGVEIYEGDIVRQYQKSRGHIYPKQKLRIVKWVNAAHNTGFNIAHRGLHRTEVIGNIYEHGHLLEKQ